MSELNFSLPARFADLKREIAASYPDFQGRVTAAWADILAELAQTAKKIVAEGPNYIPQVNFADLATLSPERIQEIKQKGSIVIKDVVDDDEAASWKLLLEQFVKANPDIEGFPEEDKQFFQLYWTKSQVLARAHPNVLAASAWLNNLYHLKSEQHVDGVDLSTPLSYADRFRIRHPGVQWEAHPPHIDGGSIERWEDQTFRTCFEDILSGSWKKHDPYDLQGRLNAKSSLYQRPGQSTILRTFQGWLALSETGPTQGTLKVFPDVLLSNSYIILRPFFRPTVPADSPDALDAKNWEFDISSPDFAGIHVRGSGFGGPRPSPLSHPHMRLEETMTSVPQVKPGDMVFWHCDVVHSVEKEHTGKGDSAVLYIPAVPLTPQNKDYIRRQLDQFIKADRPPDFEQGLSESGFVGIGRPGDILSPIGRRAMGLQIEVS